jgi:hypothetical protein
VGEIEPAVSVTAKPKPKASFFAVAMVAIFVLVMVGIPVGLIVGAFQEKAVTTPVKNGITTTGTVTGVRTDPISGRGGGSEYAEIRFTDRDGIEHEFEATSTSSTPDIGATVKVSYDPNHPEHAADLSVGSLRWHTFLVIGILLAVGEVYWAYRGVIRPMIRNRRRRRDGVW